MRLPIAARLAMISRLIGIGVDVAHERVGDLDVVGLQVQDRLEPRVAGAGVVDRDLHVRLAHEVEDVLERVVVADHLLLGDLDDDVAVAAVDRGEVALVQEDRDGAAASPRR